MTIVVSLNSENGKTCNDIPITTLTSCEKLRQNNFSRFLIRVYAQTRK